jgi:hypothetical protein
MNGKLAVAVSRRFMQQSPKYFKISHEEYLRTIGPKRDSTIAAIEKYDFEVITELDCAFVQTALIRQCKDVEDFKRFFMQVADLPAQFHDSLKLKCEDYGELVEAIEKGEKDKKLRNNINRIYKSLTNIDKRERPKQHDAGLFRGVEFLNRTKKTMILTRDNVLRELAYENAIRDEYPLAIGLDSFIQMMAINSGGTDIESTNFAPLFSKLVKASLFPEKETFKPEDLEFMLKTKIQISELPKIKVMEIAKRVNHLRMKGVPSEDIVLEIQRYFNITVSHISGEIDDLKSRNYQMELDKERTIIENEILASELIGDKYQNELSKMGKEVMVNWMKLMGLTVLLCFLIFIVFHYNTNTNALLQILVSFSISLLASLTIVLFGFKWKIRISTTDKSELKAKTIEKIKTLKASNS